MADRLCRALCLSVEDCVAAAGRPLLRQAAYGGRAPEAAGWEAVAISQCVGLSGRALEK